MPSRIDQDHLPAIVRKLTNYDPVLQALAARNGIPPLWDRPPTLATLVQIILEQQVSLTSARAVYKRLCPRDGKTTPEDLLRLGTDGIRQRGVTRQKARYILNLANAIQIGILDLHRLTVQEDAAVFEQLTSIKGIGPWSASIFLLMALGRQNIWPPGDIALEKQVRKYYAADDDPVPGWSPHRSVAARLLWHDYLIERGRE